MVVSSFPTIYGERFLLEMFDERILRSSFEETTAPYSELKQLLEDFMLRARKGMVLFTGPDGSGRSSLLYSYLSKCKDEFHEILTLENSVHYPLSGVTQTQVDPEEMDQALEEVLRQRPELLAINSLRTKRSVELAFLSAARLPLITVMSSYDCYVALDWLCRNKLKSAVKAGLLSLVVSPRLIPRICPHCSTSYEVPEPLKAEINVADAPLRMNQGCDLCRSTDQQVAETVLEYVRIDPQIIAWLEEDHNAATLRQKAREAGRKTLFDAALSRAIHGTLDMPSVLKLRPVF
jgi:type II secretory ATPase GspE/PulE/Tfp pilus assembly ATPase PilB-like protein